MNKLMEALTQKGTLNWYHLETWAQSIEAKQKYSSRLSSWLYSVSTAMKEAKELKPDLHCTIEELSDLTILPFGWVLLKRHSETNPDLIDINFLGNEFDPGRITQLEEANARLRKLSIENARLRRRLKYYARLITDDSEWEEAQAEVAELPYAIPVPELPPSDEGERLD